MRYKYFRIFSVLYMFTVLHTWRVITRWANAEWMLNAHRGNDEVNQRGCWTSDDCTQSERWTLFGEQWVYGELKVNGERVVNAKWSIRSEHFSFSFGVYLFFNQVGGINMNASLCSLLCKYWVCIWHEMIVNLRKFAILRKDTLRV